MAPLANDLIMLRRLIQLLRHLECQNLSIISDSIGIPKGSKKWKKGEEEEEEESYSYRRGYLVGCYINIITSFRIQTPH